MRSAKEYRMAAKEKLAGNYGTVIGVYFIYTMIVSILSIPSGILGSLLNAFSSLDFTILSIVFSIFSIPVSFIISAVTVVLSAGLTKVTFDIVRGGKGDITTLFYGFRNDVMTVICIYLRIILCILPAVGVLLVGGGISAALLVIPQGLSYKIAGGALLFITVLIYAIWLIVVSYAVSMAFFLYYDNPGMQAG